MLTVLGNRPGLDQSTLATELGLDRSNVADVLTRLARRKLVKRGLDPRDHRMRTASITQQGTAVVKQMFAHMQRSQDRLLAPLPPAERKLFMVLLARLVEANNGLSRARFLPR